MLAQFEKTKVERLLAAYCDQRVPMYVRDKVTMGFRIRGSAVMLFENRILFQQPGEWVVSPIARFRYNGRTGLWTLYCCDRNSKWHLYDQVEPPRDLQVLLDEIDRGPTGIFYG